MSKIKIITICAAVFIVIPFMAGQTKADLSDGLVAYYPFNGNAYDESGNGNNGTVFGAALTTDRFGNPNSAYSFDGTDDGILISESGSLNNGNFQSGYTIAAWIKPTGLPTESDYNVIVSTNGFGLRLLIYESDPDVLLEAYHRDLQGTYSWPPFAPMPRDSWYFTVTTWDGSTGEWKMFLDGNPSYPFTTDGLVENPSHPDRVAIGRGSWYDRWYFEGTIDDVRIYNRVLSDSEVTELYLMPAPVTLSGWVYMPPDAPDFGYSLNEDDLVYFYSFDFVQSFNTATGGWSVHMPIGWIYIDWPFYYELDTDTLMFALPPESGIGVYHFSTGQWEVLPRIIP